MKSSLLKTIVAASAVVAVIAACGGGGDDDAGSLTALSVQPASMKIDFVASTQVPEKTCATGASLGEAFVYGGTAPYRINNTVPQWVAIDKTQVGDRGGSFTVTSIGPGCVSNGTIVIVDGLDRQTILTVTTTPAASAASS